MNGLGFKRLVELRSISRRELDDKEWGVTYAWSCHCDCGVHIAAKGICVVNACHGGHRKVRKPAMICAKEAPSTVN